MLKLILISAVLLGIGFAGIAVKIWAKKDGEFEGTCSGKNVRLKAEGISCGCGGSGECENDPSHTNNPDRNESYFDGPAKIEVKKVS